MAQTLKREFFCQRAIININPYIKVVPSFFHKCWTYDIFCVVQTIRSKWHPGELFRGWWWNICFSIVKDKQKLTTKWSSRLKCKWTEDMVELWRFWGHLTYTFEKTKMGIWKRSHVSIASFYVTFLGEHLKGVQLCTTCSSLRWEIYICRLERW